MAMLARAAILRIDPSGTVASSFERIQFIPTRFDSGTFRRWPPMIALETSQLCDAQDACCMASSRGGRGRVAPEAIVLSGPGARLPGSVPKNGHWGVSVVIGPLGGSTEGKARDPNEKSEGRPHFWRDCT